MAGRDTTMKYATDLIPLSTVIISRFIDNDLGHDGETSDNKKEIEEKDKKLLENNDQHSYQETDLSPDSYQKAEFDEAEDHN